MRREKSRPVALALVSFGLLAAAAGARPEGPEPSRNETMTLTLAEARERAREVAPRLRASRADLAAADADLRRARAGRRPEITLSGFYQRLSDVPELFAVLPEIGRTAIFPNIPDNYGGSVGLGMPLYTGGRLAGSASAAEGRSAASAQELATRRADLDLEVTEAYWALLVARRREEVLRRAIDSFEAHLTDARNFVRFGLAARNDVLAVEVERDRAELARLDAAARARVAEADVARLVDLPLGVAIEPADELAEPAALEPVGAPGLLLAEALAARSERRALVASIGAAEGLVRSERGDRRPQLAVQADLLYARPNRNIPPFEDRFQDTWQVGLEVSVRVFDGGRSAAEVARAEAGAEAARWRLEELDRAIRLEVEARLAELETAVSAVGVTARAVESARENLRVASDRYRAGLIPSSERLDGETALLRAELDHARALAGARLAHARLDRTLGRP